MALYMTSGIVWFGLLLYMLSLELRLEGLEQHEES